MNADVSLIGEFTAAYFVLKRQEILNRAKQFFRACMCRKTYLYAEGRIFLVLESAAAQFAQCDFETI